MCTLILAWQVFEEAPVVVAANRDEAVDRPSAPPAVVEDEPRVVAPLDEEAGGTWIGYNEHGLLVAVTNRWVDGPSGERSRGLLVRDALRRSSAEEAARFVEGELRERSYQPFHLVVVDADAAVLFAWDGRLRVRNLEPGLHAVVNVGWDGSYFVPERRPDVGVQQAEDTDRVRAELRPEPGETAAAWTERAGAVLRDHDYGRCIHGDGFGTRSSSLVRLGNREATYEFADGPPCENDYRPVPDADILGVE